MPQHLVVSQKINNTLQRSPFLVVGVSLCISILQERRYTMNTFKLVILGLKGLTWLLELLMTLFK